MSVTKCDFCEDGVIDFGKGRGPERCPYCNPVVVAWDRLETEPCERGTVGCSVDHSKTRNLRKVETECETW